MRGRSLSVNFQRHNLLSHRKQQLLSSFSSWPALASSSSSSSFSSLQFTPPTCLPRHQCKNTTINKNVLMKLLSTYRENLYNILGVSKSATPQEIKSTYYKLAKKCHPDLNPNDPQAKERFQKLSYAYEILSNPSRRAQYDASGYTYTADNSGNSAYSSYNNSQNTTEHAKDIFDTVWQDVEIIKTAWNDFADDLKDEIAYVSAEMKEGNLQPLWTMAKAYKGLIFGIVAPTVLILRFPAVVSLVFRFLWAGVPFILIPLMRSGHFPHIASWLWRSAINAAKRRTERSRPKRK